MPINQLPTTTIRILGSSQAITDPVSAVKELIDNALDACARAVFVEITFDTLETIQVRDNGTGIAPEDRTLVCRHHTTSKIREYADIKAVAARYLGFRGEALAAAAELSKSVDVTTRVEGEDAASLIAFGPDGEVQRKENASHPVGTTVCIHDLFHHLPVRKQAALKRLSRTHDEIRATLEAYAFARSHVRFSLKILKSKSSKSNSPWSYVPKPDSTMFDVACKILSTECARECQFLEMTTGSYRVQALLPKRDAAPAHISGKRHFVSVDKRPVSSSRGMGKQVVGLCKERLREYLGSGLRCPFVWMEIECPRGSYDPNVEPGKMELMFEEPEAVLDALRALLDENYPQKEPVLEERDIHSEAERSGRLGEDADAKSEAQSGGRQDARRACAANMYDGEDETSPVLISIAEDLAAHYADDPDDTSAGLRDPSISNPWVIAKMHASTRNRQNPETLLAPFSGSPNLQDPSEPDALTMSRWLSNQQTHQRARYIDGSNATAEAGQAEGYRGGRSRTEETQNIPAHRPDQAQADAGAESSFHLTGVQFNPQKPPAHQARSKRIPCRAPAPPQQNPFSLTPEPLDNASSRQPEYTQETRAFRHRPRKPTGPKRTLNPAKQRQFKIPFKIPSAKPTTNVPDDFIQSDPPRQHEGADIRKLFAQHRPKPAANHIEVQTCPQIEGTYGEARHCHPPDRVTPRCDRENNDNVLSLHLPVQVIAMLTANRATLNAFLFGSESEPVDEAWGVQSRNVFFDDEEEEEEEALGSDAQGEGEEEGMDRGIGLSGGFVLPRVGRWEVDMWVARLETWLKREYEEDEQVMAAGFQEEGTALAGARAARVVCGGYDL